jgi:excisionase family DNA binding protein
MARTLIGVDDASKIVPLKPSTFRSYILNNRIPYYKIGRRVFFDRADLEALIESSAVPARERRSKAAV